MRFVLYEVESARDLYKLHDIRTVLCGNCTGLVKYEVESASDMYSMKVKLPEIRTV